MNPAEKVLLILTTSVSNRLSFITSLMMTEMLGIDVRLTASHEDYNSHAGPKLNYAREPLAEGIFVEASGLLSETSVVRHDLNLSVVDGIPVLFQSVNPLSALRFDPFAASFYMVSRYEEYLPYTPDGHNRFPAGESIATKGHFLDIPVVHAWAGMLEKLLREYYPGLEFRYPEYHFLPTIDIDHAWCYLGRSFKRTLGGLGRSLIHGRLPEIADRLKVLAGLAADPYDTYSFINRVHEPCTNFPLYFVLFADHGRDDNNVTVNSAGFHRLLRDLDRHQRVGIHPSISSGNSAEQLDNEYNGLCNVLGRKVTASRQHFLKISLPATYRSLIERGITDDFSMGYPTHAGFRAGMAMPFPFFDLQRDQATSLVIHPVTLMDVTMKDHLRLSRVESLDKIRNMIQAVRSVNGEFVSLWHNESLSGAGRWEGWRELYQEMVKLAST